VVGQRNGLEGLMPSQRLLDSVTALCCATRRIIAGNTLHPMWDVVFDAEAAIADLQTLLRWNRHELLVWCEGELEDFLEEMKERK
jgi:hypothetical protein